MFREPEHQGMPFADEELSVAPMHFKARSMNAYLNVQSGAYSKQIVWNSQKRGVQATPVIAAYSSQECSICHYTAHKIDLIRGRSAVACGVRAHADTNGSLNISRRIGDTQLRACKDRTAIKAVLMQRHEAWKQQQGMGDTRPVKRRKQGPSSSSLTSI